jgi:CHASE3 domain sensor protein
MVKGQLKYLALWFFLAGVIIIVFIQFISGQNTERLIQGNKRLLGEASIQNNLRLLEKGVLTAESDVRGAVITDDSTYMRGVDTELASINKYMELLKTALADSITSADVTLLHSLVTDKLRFTNTIIEKYKTEGALSAQAFINTGRGQSLRDSILLVINNIDTNRQKHTKQVIADIEASGVKARFWGFSLAVIACIACMLAFLYVVNKGRQQQRSIALLNESEKKIKEAAHV